MSASWATHCGRASSSRTSPTPSFCRLTREPAGGERSRLDQIQTGLLRLHRRASSVRSGAGCSPRAGAAARGFPRSSSQSSRQPGPPSACGPGLSGRGQAAGSRPRSRPCPCGSSRARYMDRRSPWPNSCCSRLSRVPMPNRPTPRPPARNHTPLPVRAPGRSPRNVELGPDNHSLGASPHAGNPQSACRHQRTGTGISSGLDAFASTR